MKVKSLLLVLVFALTPLLCAQEKPAQTPPSPGGANQMRAEHRQKMVEMHKRDGGHESRHRKTEILAR